MIKKRLFNLFLLGWLISTVNPAVADCGDCKSISGDPIWGTLYMPDGRIFESLYIKDGDTYVAPVEGETDPHEVLYNIPLEGEPVPLRQVPTLYITDRDTPVVIDESISANNPMRGLVFSGTPNPITLADWLKGGKSKLKIKVRKDGMTRIKMKIKGLLPNSLYGVWQFNQAGGPPGPWGGIPNIFATDDDGNAKMERLLPFNIYDIARSLVIVYHSDHRVYGGSPSLLKSSGGPDIHFQLKFDIVDTM